MQGGGLSASFTEITTRDILGHTLHELQLLSTTLANGYVVRDKGFRYNNRALICQKFQ